MGKKSAKRPSYITRPTDFPSFRLALGRKEKWGGEIRGKQRIEGSRRVEKLYQRIAKIIQKKYNRAQIFDVVVGTGDSRKEGKRAFRDHQYAPWKPMVGTRDHRTKSKRKRAATKSNPMDSEAQWLLGIEI